jgi:hypothetical protein
VSATRNRWLVAGTLALVAVCVWVAFARLHESPEPLSPRFSESEPGAAPASSPLDPESAPVPGIAPTRHAASAAGKGAALGPGRLRIRALDARTGALLDRVQVRAASPTRFAERSSEFGTTVVELTLTAGTYSLLVSCRGYEPAELPPLAIAAGAEVEPEPLTLQPAAARIGGAVRVGYGPERRLLAELLGSGRCPCADCGEPFGREAASVAARNSAWMRADPCPRCGYAIGSSRCELRPDGSFGFENLCGGNYTLRLMDAGERTVGVPQTLELRPCESRAVELVAPFLRAVELELLDADGSSLASEWAARLGGKGTEAEESELVIVEVVRDTGGLDFECLFRSGETCVGKATLVPPLPLGARGGGVSVGSSGHHGHRPGKQRAGVDDRERLPDETLRPESPAPAIPPPELHVRFDAQGLVRFEPLPSLPLVLALSCGAFGVDIEIPASVETTRVRAELTGKGTGIRTYREFEARTLAH